MKWSKIVAAGFALAALGALISALLLVPAMGVAVVGFAILLGGLAIALVGGAMHYYDAD